MTFYDTSCCAGRTDAPSWALEHLDMERQRADTWKSVADDAIRRAAKWKRIAGRLYGALMVVLVGWGFTAYWLLTH